MSFLSEGQPDAKDFTSEQHDAYGKIVGASWLPGAGATWAIIPVRRADDGARKRPL
jgi:hypothetical protein